MANEILSNADKVKINDMKDFLKESFCIDGDCNFIEMVEVKNTLKKLNNSMLFALGDSRRGQFYVTISK